MPTKTPNELKNLSIKIGQFMQYWGFKRIHGAIWAHVFLSKEPVDATQLVKLLGVSKALVSLAMKDLVEYDVIRRSGRGDGRKILLEANPDVLTVITNVLKKREQTLISETLKACEKLKLAQQDGRTDVDPDRLGEMDELIKTAQLALAAIIDSNMMYFSTKE